MCIRDRRKLHSTALKQTVLQISKGEYEIENDIVPMSQYDMVVTQWGFIGAAITRPQLIGLSSATHVQLQALTHQMYIVGKELGIKDEFNLCYGSLEEITEYARGIEDAVIRPALELDKDYASMSEHLLGGVNLLNPFVNPSAFAAWTHKLFGATESHKKRVSLFSNSLQTRINYWIQSFAFDYVLYYSIPKWFAIVPFNLLVEVNIYMANLLRKRVIMDVYYAERRCLPFHLWIYGIFSYIKKTFNTGGLLCQITLFIFNSYIN